MSTIGTNHPDNPFSAQGRVKGQSPEDLKKRGLSSQGHPLPSEPRKPQTSGVSRPSGGTRNQNIAQLAQSIGEMELGNQDDLHAFCEAYRAILNYLAVSAHLANGQLKASARAQAKQSKDGWMTPSQRLKLADTLRRIGKDLDHLANSCVAGAADATKAWRRFEGLLDDLEGERKVSRPSGGRRGGFSVV
ncbi:hypothetical protein [Streptomyces sp. NPDC001781]